MQEEDEDSSQSLWRGVTISSCYHSQNLQNLFEERRETQITHTHTPSTAEITHTPQVQRSHTPPARVSRQFISAADR